MKNIQLLQSPIINNSKLTQIFKCNPQGGMRRSKKTNTLVLISDRFSPKPIYKNTWQGNTLLYTGMGQTGDQDFDFAQNKTLYNSKKNGVEVHLFEMFAPQQYTYRGVVELIDAKPPYKDDQPDINGNIRKVCIFPLRLKNSYSSPTNLDTYIDEELKQSEEAKKMSNEDLEKKAKGVKGQPKERIVISTIYERNQIVVEQSKRRANGHCELCNKVAPFKNKDGNPYLEVHHIIWLSEGGDDSIDNTVALCPNCHRKMHSLKDQRDIDKLLEKRRYS